MPGKALRKFIVVLLTSYGLVIGAGPGFAQTDTIADSLTTLKRLSLEQLMDVEVSTVSRSESTVGQSPAAVFVITQEMIRRSGATAIPELFRMVPGMDVARIDNNKWAASMRGFNERFQRFLLVQIDGRTVYNPIFSGVYWDTVDLPLEDIERIEIVRGPGASVWGANAVNGVINIITKSASDTHGGLVSGGGGTHERGFGTFRYGAKTSDNTHVRVYGKGFDRDQQFSASGEPHDDWWGASGGVRLDTQVGARDTVTFDGGYFHSDAGRRDLRPQVTAPFVLTNIEDEVTEAGHLLGRWSRTLDRDSNWSLQGYWDHMAREASDLLVAFRTDTFDLDFQHQLPSGNRQKIVWGLGYRYIDVFLQASSGDGGFILSWDRPNRHLQLFSGFVQDEITLVEGTLGLMLGSKLEHNAFTGVELQPTGRVLWTPTRRQATWFAASRAVRTPNITDTEARSTFLQSAPGVGPFPALTANPEFESEELRAYELGYRAQATDTLSVDVALFCNNYDNLTVAVRTPALDPVPPPAVATVQRQNRMNGKTHGVEVGGAWQASNWYRLYGAYTFRDMQLHADPTLPAATRLGAEAAEGRNPQQQVYLQSFFNLPRNLELDVIGRAVGRLTGFNTGAPSADVPNEISGYAALDVRLAWASQRVELEIVGQNLLDRHHPESGTSTSIRAPLVELVRGVYGKVTYRF